MTTNTAAIRHWPGRILGAAAVLAVGGATALFISFGLAMGTDACFSPKQGGLCDPARGWVLWITLAGVPAAALVSAVGVLASRGWAVLYGIAGLVAPVLLSALAIGLGTPNS